MTAEMPNSAIVANLAAAAVGSQPVVVHRFSTGSHHYVYEATFEDRPPVVVRIAAEHSRSAMAGAFELSRLLRPKGVPLPRIIGEGLSHPFSHLVLERLPGADLGDVMGGLTNACLEAIAANVAAAQKVTAGTASGRRYGYSVTPADAPRESAGRRFCKITLRDRADELRLQNSLTKALSISWGRWCPPPAPNWIRFRLFHFCTIRQPRT